MNRKNIFLIASASAITIILVMLFSSLNNDSQLIDENFQNIQNIPSSSFGVERELEGDHIISLGEPKNTIIEYASMTCPHCSDFHGNIFPKIKEELIDTGKVKYTFRDFPLDPFAMAGTMIANCVSEDKYFDVINVLLKTQQKWIEKGYQGIISVAKNFEHKDKKDDICFIECLGLCCINANGLITIFFPLLKTMFSSCSSFIFLLIVSLGINSSSAISIKFIFSI